MPSQHFKAPCFMANSATRCSRSTARLGGPALKVGLTSGAPYGKSLQKRRIWWVFIGYNPQESLENTIDTMGTLLGVDVDVGL